MNIKYDCLIVEDERDLADSIKEYFEVFGLTAKCTYSLFEARESLVNSEFKIVLLDLNLPDGSGYDLCRELKASLSIPVYFISARGADDDIIRAYSIGADDYIAKPFSLGVLFAKVQAKLKLAKGTKDVILNHESMTVTVRGVEVPLTSMEYKLLAYLLDNTNRVLAKEDIFETVWQGIYNENTLNVHVKRLRDKIEVNPSMPVRIVTIWGVGYKYNDKA